MSGLRVGDTVIVSGDWLKHLDHAGYRTGYTGQLVETRSGYVVFDCTRTVVEAMCADQERLRDRVRQHAVAFGISGVALDRQVDAAFESLHLDGDVLVYGGGTGLGGSGYQRRIGPQATGRYRIDLGWPFLVVDPTDCDAIVSDPARPPDTAGPTPFVREDPESGDRLIINTPDKNDGWTAVLRMLAWVETRYGFQPAGADRALIADYTDARHRGDDAHRGYLDALMSLEERALAHVHEREPGWRLFWADACLWATPATTIPQR
ncbi:hypothetical protein Lfu02_77170 [Longispora fulva]|uniref:Uncharacterized protein n=1 Tax=Longispora fulva TaxID=619741 RepID=A0A8J7GCM9_9ACTN|nr:hypothetical protein [Longispora fulva]MBG6136164.1 hypothetical protein [Longispora fulva]GIG63345.1 hypothetical protein Lfu02_77170 [Longispora fulva]